MEVLSFHPVGSSSKGRAGVRKISRGLVFAVALFLFGVLFVWLSQGELTWFFTSCVYFTNECVGFKQHKPARTVELSGKRPPAASNPGNLSDHSPRSRRRRLLLPARSSLRGDLRCSSQHRRLGGESQIHHKPGLAHALSHALSRELGHRPLPPTTISMRMAYPPPATP